MEGAQAAEIAAAAREGGAEPVGVFVEEGAAAIEAACDAAGLRTAQLHGDGARAALRTLPERLAAIYTMAVDPAAGYAIATPTPVELIEAAFADADPDPNAWTKPNNWLTNGNARGRRTVDYLLLDGLRGGSGEVRAAPPGEGLGPAGPLEASGGSGTDDPGDADARRACRRWTGGGSRRRRGAAGRAGRWRAGCTRATSRRPCGPAPRPTGPPWWTCPAGSATPRASPR